MTTTRKSLFERLQLGVQEGIAFSKGELNLRTVEIPDDPPEIDSSTLVALRETAAMSQAVFAKMLNVSTKTVQSWEQGSRRPSDASKRLIQIFTEHPDVVCQTVGLPAIKLEGVTVRDLGQGRRKIVIQKKLKSRAE
ncbi:helix-turn-helix domain-containing protein [Planctomicrobium piriforme]|uniref:Putative transcriptional regulator n=1 Tax=Planctomicrobium piriforme TaxID=1576369 RepID=A0A1I3FTM4_9PLAN|nr:helix-turn-helix domain-containing protein [Planctomicrobium piriforme]SFI14618.1 putative transcriptional regulator [Planctomicrobium piriforme]